jgi:UDP-N-acetyl-D-mannosaminuronic acid transferase (WecB/TagA/CpsF family)
MKTASVLSIDIAAATREVLRGELFSYLRGTKTRVVGKVPAEFLVRTLRDQDFRAYLLATDLNVADGSGVLWAARFLTLKTVRLPVIRQLQTVWQAAYSLASLILRPSYCRDPIPERIRGVDALTVMLEAAQMAKAPVYFLGAEAEVNEGAREKIKTKYPGLTIAGGRDGYFLDDEAAVGEINRSGAALLIVALGSPKQEYWIRDNLSKLSSVKAVSLEWLWRLTMHRNNKTGGVSRARRVWNAVPVFIFMVVKYRLEHGTVTAEQLEPA